MLGPASKQAPIRWPGFAPIPGASARFIARTGRRIRPRATKFCSERAKPIGKESSTPRRTGAEWNTISSNKRAAALQNSRPRAAAWRHSKRHTQGRRIFGESNKLGRLFLLYLDGCLHFWFREFWAINFRCNTLQKA